MMRARRYIYNEECVIDIPPAEDLPDHHRASSSSSGDTEHLQLSTKDSLQISAQMAIALCAYALTGSSSHQPPAVSFVAAGAAVGFLSGWMAIAVRRKKPGLADLLDKISITATASAVVVPMGLLLVPAEYKWLSVLPPLIPTIATFLC